MSTRELLLRTHLPNHQQRVDASFAEGIVQAVRASGKNRRVTCEPVQHFMLYDMVVLNELDVVDPDVFSAIQSWWQQRFQHRSRCTMKVLSPSKLEVLCPVSTAASLLSSVASPATSRTPHTLFKWILSAIVTCLLHQRFVLPYHAWLVQPADSGSPDYMQQLVQLLFVPFLLLHT